MSPESTSRPVCQTCGAQDSSENPVLRYLERVYSGKYRWAWRCRHVDQCWDRYDRAHGLAVTPAITLSEYVA